MRDANDAWFESEESTRKVMIQEAQRIRRRARVHWVWVLALAIVMSAGISYKILTKKQHYEAEVVLALREGSLSDKRTGLPLGELREFVKSVLIPDNRLAELIERRNLERLRHRMGIKWAIAETRERIAIEVWRNTWVYYDPEHPNREASARIGITVTDEDPDKAYLLAHDLASIVIDETREHRYELASKLSTEVTAMRTDLEQTISTLEREKTEKMVAMAQALRAGKKGLAQAYHLRLTEIDGQEAEAEKTLHQVSTSQDAIADQIAAAGLDIVVEVVGEHRPFRPENRGLWLALALIIAAIGALCGSALIVGAFDSRVHDTEDIERLGLPVLGHVPGFPGDRVGSLEARGVQRPALRSR